VKRWEKGDLVGERDGGELEKCDGVGGVECCGKRGMGVEEVLEEMVGKMGGGRGEEKGGVEGVMVDWWFEK
uniref:hypothetical protein n=1 Tax=Neisseria sicca TaxID=490 RepID=UPI001C9A0DB7